MRGRPIDARQRRKDRLDALVELEPAAAGELQRAPHAALGQALEQRPLLRRRRLHLGRGERGVGRSPQMLARRAAPGPGAGSASGWSAAAGSARDEISRNSARRGGSSSDFNSALAALMLSSSALSTITTRHASSPPVRPRNDLQPPHLVDEDAGREALGALIVGPAQHQKARMRQRADLPRRRRLRADLEAQARRIARLGSRQHMPRQPVGQRRLADALASRDQPGVVHAPAGEGLRPAPARPRHGR